MTKQEAERLKALIDELTSEEPTKEESAESVPLCLLNPGEKFLFGDWTLTVLDQDALAGTLCLTDEIVEMRTFNDHGDEYCNNWAFSSLRKYLNGEFLDGLKCDKDILIPFERDLTADDGLKDYGICTDKVSLLTCDEYRKYREFIDNKDDWWWTITAYSANSGSSNFARRVNTDGSLIGTDAFYGYTGVSPAYRLLSSIMVTKV